MTTNPLLGSNRSKIFASAIKLGGKGARLVDDGAHLTLWDNRTTVVAISVPTRRALTFTSQNRRTVVTVRVNVDTFETSIEA